MCRCSVCRLDCTAGGADDGICELTGITVDDLGSVTGTEIDNLTIYIDTDTAFSGSEPSVADATFAGVSKAIDLTSIAIGTRQVSAGIPKYIWVTYDLADRFRNGDGPDQCHRGRREYRQWRHRCDRNLELQQLRNFGHRRPATVPVVTIIHLSMELAMSTAP